MSSTRSANHHRVQPVGDSAGQPPNRIFEQYRVIAAALGFVIGVGLLLAGVVINVIPIAVAGFVGMLTCSLWAATSYQRMTAITTGRACGVPELAQSI